MTYTPATAPASTALENFRQALAQRATLPVDVLILGDSISEGYYASDDQRRWTNLMRQRLQALYNPSGVQGGEGYIPSVHTVGGLYTTTAPAGYANLPQRFNSTTVAYPETDNGYGLGRRSVLLNATTESAYSVNPFYGDRLWVCYTSLPTTGFMGIGIDGTLSWVKTQGVLSGTGTGTFTVNVVEDWPTGPFTITIDDEDMTVTNGTGSTLGTFTITARGINGTTAATHAVNALVLWAPAGVVRVNTYNQARTSGRIWDSGLLTRGPHKVYVVPINRTGAGGNTFNVQFDGVMVFDGDGGPSRAKFSDGVTTNASAIFTSATANFTSADVGKEINIIGAGIPGATTISSVQSVSSVTLSQNATATATGVTFTLGGRGAGIRIWDGSHFGTTTSSFAGPAGTAAGYWADALDNIDPDLVIVALGTNDNSAPAVLTNYNSIVSLINSKCIRTPSYVFMIPYQINGVTSAQWQPIRNAIYQAAVINGAAVWDLGQAMSQAVPNSSALWADGVHPNDAGSAEIALQATRFFASVDLKADPKPKPDWSLALTTWRRSLSEVAVRPVDVVMLGDSITEGYWASDDAHRYSNLLRQRLQSQYNPIGVVGGEGWIPALHVISGMVTSSPPTGFTTIPQRWTFTGVTFPVGDGGYGLGRRGLVLSTTQTATITVVCDRFWIMYTAGTGVGTISIQIDGGTAATKVTTSTVTQSGRVWDSGNLALGAHTVKVTASAGAIILDGIMVFAGDGGDVAFTDGQTTSGAATLTSYTATFSPGDVGKTVTGTNIPASTTIAGYISVNQVTMSANATATGTGLSFTVSGRGKGVRVWEAGHVGHASRDYIGPESTVTGAWADGLDSIDPRLVLIQLGPNDLGNQVPATYQQNLVSIVTLIRLKALSNPSIFFVANWVPGFASFADWQPYRDAMYQVASMLGCGVIDLANRMGPAPASGSNDVFSDTLHLTNNGEILSANEHALALEIPDQANFIKYDREYLLRRTNSIAETFTRGGNPASATLAVLATGTLFLQGVGLFAGDVISNIGFISGTTAAGTPTHWWFVLADANRIVRAVTADQTSTAWAASTEKVLAVGTPFTVPADGLYYIGLMVAATTVPTMQGLAGSAILGGVAPILSGASNTGQTTPPALGATLTAITASANQVWGYVS